MYAGTRRHRTPPPEPTDRFINMSWMQPTPAQAWILLALAGLLEIGWAIGMKYTDGFSRAVPSAIVMSAAL
ncbi:MAG TPA: SMR family transporter, partial [Burkholderiaceae bacterium]|nr:SMR family transporter [Burkholderiaceae bacterium]